MLRIDVPIDLAALANAQERIEAFLAAESAPESLILRVRLVVEELFANLVMHGRFAVQPPPAARLAVALAGGVAQVTIEDAAAPFDPRPVAAPVAVADISQVPIGGLGLPLVRRMAHILAYGPTESGWNRTELLVAGT
jgi:anti-sigma regulatory factor (Ser/Thr protein kinase)